MGGSRCVVNRPEMKAPSTVLIDRPTVSVAVLSRCQPNWIQDPSLELYFPAAVNRLWMLRQLRILLMRSDVSPSGKLSRSPSGVRTARLERLTRLYDWSLCLWPFVSPRKIKTLTEPPSPRAVLFWWRLTWLGLRLLIKFVFKFVVWEGPWNFSVLAPFVLCSLFWLLAGR